MDLPDYYRYRDEIDLDRQKIPPAFLEKLVESWKSPSRLTDRLPPNGWSNNWYQFQKICDWMMPTPRWGTSDPDYQFDGTDPVNIRIRNRLGLLGDVYPVLYKEDNHDIVIFVVGERPYIYSYREELDDCIGAISSPLSALFDEGRLNDIYNDRSQWNNLGNAYFYSLSANARASAREWCKIILDHLATGKIGPRPLSNPETWSDDQWNMLHKSYKDYFDAQPNEACDDSDESGHESD